MSFDDLLPQTAIISRATRSGDGQGGWTEAFGVVASGVACHLTASSGADDIAGEQERAKTSHTLALHADTDIRRGDQVEVDSGETLTIIAVRHAEGGKRGSSRRLRHIVCDAEQITRGV